MKVTEKNRLFARASDAQKADLKQWFEKIKGLKATLTDIKAKKDDITSWIETHYKNPNTRSHHLQTLTALLKRGRVGKKKREDFVSKYKEEKEKYLKSCEESIPKKDYVDYKSICKLRDHYLVGSTYDEKEYWYWFTLCLYTYFPPIRSEWFNCRIVEGDPTSGSATINASFAPPNENYIYNSYGDWHLVINHDKVTNTEKGDDPVDIDLSDPIVIKVVGGNLSHVLDVSIKHKPRSYVIPKLNDPNEPMGDYYKHFLHQIFCGRQVGINILRQAFVSYLKPLMISTQERNHLAQLMRHSRSVADNIYFKLGSTEGWVDEVISNMKALQEAKEAVIELSPAKSTTYRKNYLEKNRDAVYCRKLLTYINSKGTKPRNDSIKRYELYQKDGKWCSKLLDRDSNAPSSS